MNPRYARLLLALLTLTITLIAFSKLTQDPERDEDVDWTPIIRARWRRRALYTLTGTLYHPSAPTEGCEEALYHINHGSYAFYLTPGCSLESLKQRLRSRAGSRVDLDGAFASLRLVHGAHRLETDDAALVAALRGDVDVDLIACRHLIQWDGYQWSDMKVEGPVELNWQY